MANYTNRKTANITFTTAAAFTTALMLVQFSYQRKTRIKKACFSNI